MIVERGRVEGGRFLVFVWMVEFGGSMGLEGRYWV